MEQYARPPPELSNKGPMDKAWRIWKQQFLTFLKASGNMDRPQDEIGDLFLNLIGPVGHEACDNLIFENEYEKGNVVILMAKFDNLFDPPKIEAKERYNFFTSSKKSYESIDDYVDELKIKAKTCNFGSLTESLIRDKIVMEANDIKDVLMQQKNLDLTNAVAQWKEHEKIEKLKKGTEKPKHAPSTSTPGDKKRSSCFRCGMSHGINNCSAMGKTCQKCNKMNHLTECCNYALFTRSANLDHQVENKVEESDVLKER